MTDDIVAVKRDSRERVDPNWKSRLKTLEGVVVKEGYSHWRVQIEADSGRISDIEKLLGDNFRVEPIVLHAKL